MQVTADRDRCIGSGMCVLTVPAVFDQCDEDGLVRVRDDRPPPDLADEVRRAARMCPAQAIATTEK